MIEKQQRPRGRADSRIVAPPATRSASAASGRLRNEAAVRSPPIRVRGGILDREERRARNPGGAAVQAFAGDQRGANRASRSWSSTPWMPCTRSISRRTQGEGDCLSIEATAEALGRQATGTFGG